MTTRPGLPGINYIERFVEALLSFFGRWQPPGTTSYARISGKAAFSVGEGRQGVHCSVIQHNKSAGNGLRRRPQPNWTAAILTASSSIAVTDPAASIR
jgi:hypothetical protein